ncbi:hypothetical protein FHG87_012844 [Trinorchestia longiramus]|nr:hypothetical protein FHG87_012844 [Trinorchestia longiramus]
MYGKTLRLPGDIVNPNLSNSFSLANQNSCAECLKDCMRQIQYAFPPPTNTYDRRSITDVVEEFFHAGNGSLPEGETIASSSPSSCCIGKLCGCDSISKAQCKLKIMKEDPIQASSQACSQAGSSYQESSSTTPKDCSIEVSLLSPPANVSAAASASVQSVLQVSSSSKEYNFQDSVYSDQLRNTFSTSPTCVQSGTLWQMNDLFPHSRGLGNCSGTSHYYHFDDKIERSSMHNSKKVGNSSGLKAHSKAGSVHQKSTGSRKSDSDTDVDIIVTAVKEPEVITLNDDSCDEGDDSLVEEGEIISCCTSPVPIRTDLPVAAAVKEQTTLKEKLSKMEFFAEAKKLPRDSTSALHLLEQSNGEKSKHQQKDDMQTTSRSMKRKCKDSSDQRQRKISKKERAILKLNRKPPPGTLAELLLENHPKHFSARVAKKAIKSNTIAVASIEDSDDHCSHSGSDVEEEELMLRKLALESVVVSLENENQRKPKVLLSPVVGLANQDISVDKELNSVVSKECETPVDMEISNSDAEMETKLESGDNQKTFTFPIEWAYMIPPPAAAHQQNDFNSFESFSYEQNLCKQAMESSVQSNFAEGGETTNTSERLVPQNFYPVATPIYSNESTTHYPNQCTSTDVPLPVHVLESSPAVCDVSGSSLDPSYGYTLSQTNAHNQEAFMNAVAKQTKSNEANLIHIKLNKTPAAKKVRKRGRRSNKVLNKAQIFHSSVTLKDAPVDGSRDTAQSEDEELSLRNELLRSMLCKAQAVSSSTSVQAKSNIKLPLQSNEICTDSPVNDLQVSHSIAVPYKEDVRPRSSAAEALPVKPTFRYPKPIIINLDEDSDSDDFELPSTSSATAPHSGISSPGLNDRLDELLKGIRDKPLESTDSGSLLSIENSCPTVMKHLSRSSQVEYHCMQLRIQEIYQDKKRRRDRQAEIKTLAVDKDKVSTPSDTSDDSSQPEQSCFSNETEVKNASMKSNDLDTDLRSSEKDVMCTAALTGPFDQANAYERLGQNLDGPTSSEVQYEELFKDTDIDERDYLASLREDAISGADNEPESEEDLRTLLLRNRVRPSHGSNDAAMIMNLDHCKDLREVLSYSSVKNSDSLHNSNEQYTSSEGYSLQSISERIDCYLKSIRKSSTLKTDKSCVEEKSEKSFSSAHSSASDSSSEVSSSLTESEVGDSDSDVEGNKENSPLDKNAEICQSKCMQTPQDHTLQPNVQQNVCFLGKQSSVNECVPLRQRLSSPNSGIEYHEGKSSNNEAIVDQNQSASDTDMRAIDFEAGTNSKNKPECALRTVGNSEYIVKTGASDESSLPCDSNIRAFVKEDALPSGVSGTMLQASDVSKVDQQPCLSETSIQSKNKEISRNESNEETLNVEVCKCVTKMITSESNNTVDVSQLGGFNEDSEKLKNNSSASTTVKEAAPPPIKGAASTEEDNISCVTDIPSDVPATVSSFKTIISGSAQHATVSGNVDDIMSTNPSTEHNLPVISDADSVAPTVQLSVPLTSNNEGPNSATTGSPAILTLTQENSNSGNNSPTAYNKQEKLLPLYDQPRSTTTDVPVKEGRKFIPNKKLSNSGASSEGSTFSQRSSSGICGVSKIKQAKLSMLSKYERLIQERKVKLQSLQADVKRKAVAVRSVDSERQQLRDGVEKLEKELTALRAQYKFILCYWGCVGHRGSDEQYIVPTCPTVPFTCPTVPFTCPTVPFTCPTVPFTCPTVPFTCPTVPLTCPTVPFTCLTCPTVPYYALQTKSMEHYRSSQRLAELQDQAAADALTLTKLHTAARQLGKQVVGSGYRLECQISSVALGSSRDTQRRCLSAKRPLVDALTNSAKRHKTWTRSLASSTKWSNDLPLFPKARTSVSGNTGSSVGVVIKSKSTTASTSPRVIRKSSNFKLDNRPVARVSGCNTRNLSRSRSPSKSPSSLSDSSPKRSVNPLSESELRNRLLQKLQQNSQKQTDLQQPSINSVPYCPFGLLGTCNDENCTLKHVSSGGSNGKVPSPGQQQPSVEDKVMLNLDASECCDSDASEQVSSGKPKSCTASENLVGDVVNGKLEKGDSSISDTETTSKNLEESVIAKDNESDGLDDDESDDSSSDSDDSDSSSSDSDSDSDSSSDSSVVDLPGKSVSVANDLQDENVNMSVISETEETISNVDAPSEIHSEKKDRHRNQVSVNDLTCDENNRSDKYTAGASVSGISDESECIAEPETIKYTYSRAIRDGADDHSSSGGLVDASTAYEDSDVGGSGVVGSVDLERKRTQYECVAMTSVGLKSNETSGNNTGICGGVQIGISKIGTECSRDVTKCGEKLMTGNGEGSDDQMQCCSSKQECMEGGEYDGGEGNCDGEEVGSVEEKGKCVEEKMECDYEEVECKAEKMECLGKRMEYFEQKKKCVEEKMEHGGKYVKCVEEIMEFGEEKVKCYEESEEYIEEKVQCVPQDVESRKKVAVSRGEDMQYLEKMECSKHEIVSSGGSKEDCGEDNKNSIEESKEEWSEGSSEESRKECSKEIKECSKETKECSEKNEEECGEESEEECGEENEQCGEKSECVQEIKGCVEKNKCKKYKECGVEIKKYEESSEECDEESEECGEESEESGEESEESGEYNNECSEEREIL